MNSQKYRYISLKNHYKSHYKMSALWII
jgi:hypothetical protein